MAKETDYKAVAQQIIEVVGGPENIISVAHCATRLRLIVKNREIIDDKQVEAIDIVKGCFFTAGQYQIILGTGIVNKVYDEVMKLGIEGSSKNEQAAAAAKRGNKLQQLIRVFADVIRSDHSGNGCNRTFHGTEGIPDTGCTACILWNFSRCDSKTVPGIYTDFN